MGKKNFYLQKWEQNLFYRSGTVVLGALASKTRTKTFIESTICPSTFGGQLRAQVVFMALVSAILTVLYIIFAYDVVPDSKETIFDPYVQAVGWIAMSFAIPFMAHALVVISRVYREKRFNRTRLMGSLFMILVTWTVNICWVINSIFFLGPDARQPVAPNVIGLIANSLALILRFTKRNLPLEESACSATNGHSGGNLVAGGPGDASLDLNVTGTKNEADAHKGSDFRQADTNVIAVAADEEGGAM